MSLKKLFSVFFVSLFLISNVYGKEHFLLTVSSNVDNEVSDLILLTDDQDEVTGLKLTYRFEKKDPSFYNASLLDSEIVLKEKDGYKVITINSNDFDFTRGGHINMSYLYNGLTGSRKNAEFKVLLENDGWKVYHKGQLVRSAYFKGRYILGRLVGVKSVVFK